jgi:type III secretion protein Q
MIQRPSPLRDRLPAIDEIRAERQTRLIAALNARRLGEQTLSARLALARDRRAASAWVRFRAGGRPVTIAPLLVDGELVRLSGAGGGPDAAIAARLLAAIEPLVVALESALGADLHPEGLTIEAPDDAILLRLDAACTRHSIRHRLIVAVPAEGEIASPALPSAEPALLATLRTRWTASIDAPAIPASHIGTIVPGDLFLLGLTPLVARITIPGRRGLVRGRLEPMKGSMTLHEDIVPSPADTAAAVESKTNDASPIDWDAMKVAATIEIEGGLLSARDIAGLAAGSVLPVPNTGGTLAVRVIAGGTLIGAGELVAVGDGFGVLFTSASDADSTGA